MSADNQTVIKNDLRKLIKDPTKINSVTRIARSEVLKKFRDLAAGKVTPE